MEGIVSFIARVTGLYTALVLVIAPIELYLAFLVYNQDRSDRRNRLFFVFALSMVSFLITNYLADGITTPMYALWDLRFYFVFTSILTTAIFLFSFIFPRDLGESGWVRKLLLGYGIVASVLSLTPLIVTNATIESWGSNVVGGPLFFPYNIINLALLIILFVSMFRTYLKSKGQARGQSLFLFLGFFLFFTVNLVVNVILPIAKGTNELARYGSYASAFFVGFTAYAIIAQHLFDIRVFIRRTVVYSGLLLFAVITYSAIVFLTATLFGGESNFQIQALIPNILAATLIAFGFDPLKRVLQDRTDSFLFKKEYEEQAVLRELAKGLNDVIGLDKALEVMMQIIVKVFHLNHAITYVFQPGDNGATAIKRIRQIGYTSTNHLYLNDKDFVVTFFAKNKGLTSVPLLQQQLNQEARKFNYVSKKDLGKVSPETGRLIREHAIKQTVVKKLESLGATLAIPLHLNDQPLGLILLSNKLSGDTFTPEDLELLETIGSQAISSIEKARLYEGDQMKSEFVSIASHELLTPVSAIEGYLSMILDENLGTVDAQAREYLTKVYTSSKRLSALIRDLLSVSRIEAGRLRVESQSLDIEKIIKDTIDQLKFLAQDKKLSLTYEAPSGKLPSVWADPDRTMQILVNLVSNAIKYTPKGSVVIRAASLTQPTPHVRVEVIDTGMGMTKQAQSHLYEKFYRVSTPETTGIVGTGLGLYITKSIIEKMGGTITVKSTPGKGSTFAFTLPLFKVETSSTQ